MKAAATGVRFDTADPFLAIRREAQLLVGYRGSPIVGPVDEALAPGVPQACDRAPDARGLVRDIVRFPVRLFELFRTPGHSLLLYTDSAATVAVLDDVADAARAAFGDDLVVHAVLADGVAAAGLVTPVLQDAAGEFRAAYAAVDGTLLGVRPDGYFGHRGSVADVVGYAAGVVAPATEPSPITG
ncbi:hypothetical protein [Pseudonocardia oroxyli]|uniref:Uncharacterized protein n=1 Tax=Pseudonocardia oroxyli TaxID=366584 RepID=A0A1G7RWM0_PSEOR|nr:hypothetical protein [Pseudonocardia oroxyli]SDG15148.1 hypothetical protein SAMN05216377_109163 [Pseudonocardia oroxyli]